MTHSRRHAVKHGAGWLLPLVLAVGAGVSVVVAASAVALRMARLVLAPSSERVEDVRVVSVDRRRRRVELSRHPDTVVPGRYSLFYGNERGHAQLGDILFVSETTVTRELIAETRGKLSAGMKARVSGWFYEGPADLQVAFEEVEVATPLGPAPAWLVPPARGGVRGDRHPWVIQVHGRGVDRREPVRAIPVFRDAGYTSLLISYRNDGVAPESPDGNNALGDVEWMDVDAAIGFAESRGATSIVLMGWSMGGALVLQAITRSSRTKSVRGVVLDSPVVDWIRVLDHQAGAMKVPRIIRSVVYELISRPWGRRFTGQQEAIDLARLDFVRRAAELSLPVLLMHSDGDTYVPSAGSAALARSRPDIVHYARFDGAGHTRLWNYDPARWNREIREWLDRLDGGVRPPSSP